MRIALVGPPQSGKSTLFAAVAEAGGSDVHISRPDQPHLAVVKVPDGRVDWMADFEGSKKRTPAELEFLDLPGFDLSSEDGRDRCRAHWQAMGQSDMLVFVVAGFSDPTVAAYRGRVDAAGDVEELQAEMLFADLERVMARVEKLEAAIKKPTPRRDEQTHELELMKRLLSALEAEQPIAEAIHGEAESKLVRSFQFLTLKPVLVVVNCGESEAAGTGPGEFSGLPRIQLSAKIEEELAQLPADDRQEFLAEMGLSDPARDRLIRACYERLDLISFLTAGPAESRAWSIPAGSDAVAAAGAVHTDMARGFIRAEVVTFEDLRAAGSYKAAKAAGKTRVEGKSYVVQDGDVILFRFNV